MAKYVENAENLSDARQNSTKEAILTATCELVARQGLQGTTVRDITAASGANVAAVNYHFQSKENLVAIATQRITHAVNAERERRLQEALGLNDPLPLSAEQILRVLIEPILTHSRSADGGSLYARVSFQLRTAPYAAESIQHLQNFGATARRIIAQMARSFPQLGRQSLVEHYEFARGSALHMVIGLDPLSRRIEMLMRDEDADLSPLPSLTLDQAAIDRIIAQLLPSFGKL